VGARVGSCVPVVARGIVDSRCFRPSPRAAPASVDSAAGPCAPVAGASGMSELTIRPASRHPSKPWGKGGGLPRRPAEDASHPAKAVLTLAQGTLRYQHRVGE
jgi:hypothetical protein